jgi:hypothetical protein
MGDSGSIDSREPAAGGFATTRWSVVVAAGARSTIAAQQALERLCQAYWQPVYAFIRRTGHEQEDARDLTQDFFADLIADKSIGRADPNRGRFRSFLLGALKHFLADARDRANARKRVAAASLSLLIQLFWKTDSERRGAMTGPPIANMIVPGRSPCLIAPCGGFVKNLSFPDARCCSTV